MTVTVYPQQNSVAAFGGTSSLFRKPVVAWPSCSLVGGTYVANAAGDVSGTARHPKFALQTCTGIQASFGNYYAQPDNQVPANAGPITVQVTLEYPVDVFTRVTFGGRSTVTIDLFGLVQHDPVNIVIPQYAKFWYRTKPVCSYPGVLPVGAYGSHLDGVIGAPWPTESTTCGDNYVQHSSPTTAADSLTATGQAWINFGANAYLTYGPLEVRGTPVISGKAKLNLPTIGIIGTSISLGFGDTLTPNNGYNVGAFGYIERALIDALLGYVQVSKSGETGVTSGSGNAFLGNDAYSIMRITQIESCTSVIWDHCTNDAFNGTTWAVLRPAVLAAWAKVCSRVPNLFACTAIPRLANATNMTPASAQTLNAASFDTVRQSYNLWLRTPYSGGAGNSAAYDCANYSGGAIPLMGVFDPASLIETDSTNAAPGGPTAPNLGNHVYCGSGNATVFLRDGVHPNSAGALLLKPAIKTALLTAV